MYQKDFFNSARRPPYIYRRSPLHNHSFLILRRPGSHFDPEPYATYTVLDRAEDPLISERKVINLVALLNGQKVAEVGAGSGVRLLHHRPEKACGDKNLRTVVFYALGEDGPSRENALLTLETAEAADA